MSLKVKDVLGMEYLEEFTLLAGENGLDRYINTVGILDHELLENMMDIFVEGEFVLTTLSVARDNVDLVFGAVKALVDQKAAALAIKSVYYDSLPKEIIEYANQNRFPIFLFHPSIFIENIISTVFGGIKSRGLHTLLEIKLETLFSGTVNPSTVKEIALELNPAFAQKSQTYFCQEKRFLSEESTIRIIDKYSRIKNRNSHHSILKFRKGFFIILSCSSQDMLRSDLDLQYIFEMLGLKQTDYIIGKSTEQLELFTLDTAIKESYYAYQSALLNESDFSAYENLGLNRLLMSIADQPWAERYSTDMISPILEYDLKYQTKLYETMKQYLNLRCNTAETAVAMFQHKNTILQRIRKVKELTGPYNSDQDFYEQISTAIKIHEIRRNVS